MRLYNGMNAFRSRFRAIGIDGYFTFLLSNCVIVLLGGTSYLWQLRHVLLSARCAGTRAKGQRILVVLGARLSKAGQPTADFVARLDRAYSLWLENNARVVVVAGGTSRKLCLSEGECGKRYLTGRGMPSEQVLVEERSHHTLENLRNVSELIRKDGASQFAMITNRYHLPRSEVIALGMGMKPVLCAAEGASKPSVRHLPRLLLEAYYVHWYRVGALWSRLVRNDKSLARIS